jgi:hypothetical protein
VFELFLDLNIFLQVILIDREVSYNAHRANKCQHSNKEFFCLTHDPLDRWSKQTP